MWMQMDVEVKRKKGWQPYPPDLGARISWYRCFLPDLAGFPAYRRKGTDSATIDNQSDTLKEKAL